MDQSSEPSLLTSLRDIIVVGGIIAAVNLGVARDDFGWLQMNPTPWLLLPALLGARYGVILGIAASASAVAVILAVQGRIDPGGASGLAQHHPFFFTALVVAGFVSGEFRRYTKGRSRELLETTHAQSEELYRVKAELELCRETRHALQNHLATHQASIANLDDDLRKIILTKPTEQLDALLALLQQHSDIISAAIYRQSGSKLKRLAAIEPTAALAETLSLDAVPLAAQAIEQSSIASVKDPMGTTSAQPFLAALPFRDGDGMGVLLVQDVPYHAFNWANLSRMDLILHWTFAMLRLRLNMTGEGSAASLVSLDEFMVLLGQSLQAESTHALPSAVIRVGFTDLDQARDPKVERRLLASLPAVSIATRLPAHGSLVILLPFAGDMEAEAVTRELHATGVAKLTTCHYLAVGGADTQTFWSQVLKDEG